MPPSFVAAVLRCALVALLLLPPALTQAGNSDEILLGNEAALVGGAVTATSATGGSLWYNPAGLAAAPYDAIDVSASAYTARWVSIPDLLTTPAGRVAPGSYTELLAIPSALTYVRPLSPRAVLGVGVFVPQYSEVEVKSVLDLTGAPATRWLFAQSDALKRYYFSAGLGWRLSDTFRLGGTAALVYESQAQFSQFSGGTITSSGNADFITVSQQLSRKSVGVEFGLGTQWQFASRWIFGAALRLPGIFFASDVSAAETVAAAVNAGFSDGGTAISIEAGDGLGFSVEPLNPLRLRVGLAHLWRRFTFSAEGDLTAGANNQALSLARAPTWNVRAGVKCAPADRWLLGAGFFTDRSTASPVDVFDINFLGFSGGVQYTNARQLAAQEKQSALFFSTTLAVRYAYGRGNSSGLSVPDHIAIDLTLEPRSLDVTVHELTIHLGSALYF